MTPPASANRSVAVVVVTHNAESWVPLCLGSLRRSSLPVRVVVVDNASTDRTVDIVRSDYPEVHLIASPRNLGFGNANNLGFRALESLRPDAVYLLNQDAAVEPDTLERLLDALDRHPRFGVLSPVHLSGNRSDVDKLFLGYLPKRRRDILTGDQTNVVEVPFVNAAHWLVRRECLDALGGFAPIFHHYGEDANFLQRLRKAGWRVGILPSARAIHAREERPFTRERNLLALYGVYLSRACNPLHPFVLALPRAWFYLVWRLLALDAWPKNCLGSTLRRACRDLPAICRTRRHLSAFHAAPPAESILDNL